jgi:hypothetical protein
LLLPEDFVVYLCAVDREALLLRHCCDKIGNLRCTPP